MKYIIVAYDKNRLIGSNNSLIWQEELPADMRHFKNLTAGNVVVMGRKTYESISKPLPERQNIVISRQQIEISGVQVVHSLEEAYKAADLNKDIFVIGGGEVFEQSLSTVNQIIATEIDASFNGDSFFPALTDEWHETSVERHEADDRNKYNYSFVKYSRQK